MNPDAKWRIACINWSHKNAPHAIAYYIDGERLNDQYFPTWAEAVIWVDKITKIPRPTMNPDRIRASLRMLYPDEMTPTAKNVLERILDDEEIEAPASAGASDFKEDA